MKAKIYAATLIGSIFLMSGQCKKEGENCHHSIIIRNKSANPIRPASMFTTIQQGQKKCGLGGEILLPDTEFKRDSRSCWEDVLSKGKTFELYIIDPSLYNYEGFYNCDSITIKNKILKYYNLSLEDLKRSNFTITYE